MRKICTKNGKKCKINVLLLKHLVYLFILVHELNYIFGMHCPRVDTPKKMHFALKSWP